ncbi:MULTISPECIES: ScpA family protein [unclassified Deinococcus]|uniref:segregation and condensation protein A n=1 Tax=unclassified Deinococcus TaxID=2623546 RepID=UPI0010555DB4|nr:MULTISPECIES: ScpA family protein [unclassified Deinococcus]MBI0445238.1 segregation/condensation protein A [Deinococcus sp. DB0503]TDE86081.1 segregation/condensation protein A [Deinococcus sp. S9]
MTTIAPPPPISFVVRLPHFEGSLAELASALRTGRIGPGEVGLFALTREVLSWAQSQGVEGHPEALPTLANVIALKARLLLPQPEPDPVPEGEWDPDPLDDLVEGVEALAELDALVGFLAARRREREGLIPARPVPLDLPRRERPAQPARSLARLVRAAQNAVRQVEVPLLSRERLTLADALTTLRAFGRRLRTFTFRGIPAGTWGERTTYFAALLEGVKEGSFSAEQREAYGEIQVTSHLTQD